MEHVSEYNGRQYKFAREKRKQDRAEFNLEVYYPHINGDNRAVNSETKGAVLVAINISETGICFKSKVPLKKGDFIEFLLSVEGNPSFHVMAEVKWFAYDDDFYLAGCEFFCLTLEQINLIRKYVKNKLTQCAS